MTYDDEFGHFIRREEDLSSILQTKEDKKLRVEYLRDMSADEELIAQDVLVISYNDHTIGIFDIDKEYLVITDVRFKGKLLKIRNLIKEYFACELEFVCKDYQN